jgi:hypothetical protein
MVAALTCMADLTGPGVEQVAASFWRRNRGALVASAGSDPVVRDRLVELFPAPRQVVDFTGEWIGILAATGVVDCSRRRPGPMAEPRRGPGCRPGGWAGSSYPRGPLSSAAPLPATVRPGRADGGTVAADGVPVDLFPEPVRVHDELDLLDLCLALDVPVADHGQRHLSFTRWRGGFGRATPAPDETWPPGPPQLRWREP